MGNEKITGNMSMIDMLMVMAEGNPGAFTVLTQMMKSPNGLFDILLLDSLDIRGAKIWCYIATVATEIWENITEH